MEQSVFSQNFEIFEILRKHMYFNNPNSLVVTRKVNIGQKDSILSLFNKVADPKPETLLKRDSDTGISL